MRLKDPNALLLSALLFLSSAPACASGGDQAYPGYLALEPPITVNLSASKSARYLRVDIQFFVETNEDAASVELHTPLIRDRLITLLGGRDPDRLMAIADRDQLRAEVLAKLQETLTMETGSPRIREVFFTGFIVQ